MDIFFSRQNEDDRSVKIMTGTLGAILFHQAIANLANGFLTVDTNYIRKETSYNGTPALGFGAEFTRYYGQLWAA